MGMVWLVEALVTETAPDFNIDHLEMATHCSLIMRSVKKCHRGGRIYIYQM